MKLRTYTPLLTHGQADEFERIGHDAFVALLTRDVRTLASAGYRFHDDPRRVYKHQQMRTVSLQLPVDVYDAVILVGGVVYVRDVLECHIRSKVEEPAPVAYDGALDWMMQNLT